MAPAARTRGRSAATKKATKKKAPARKAPARKSATKSRSKAKSKNGSNGAPSPIEGKIKGEAKYKIKAVELEFEQEERRIMDALAPDIQRLIQRTKRNDPGWLKAAKARQDTINEYLDKEVPKLPDGFAVVRLNAKDGTYVAVHDPSRRDQRFAM